MQGQQARPQVLTATCLVGRQSLLCFLQGIPIFHGGTPVSVLQLITSSGPHLKSDSVEQGEVGKRPLEELLKWTWVGWVTDIGTVGGKGVRRRTRDNGQRA